MEDYLPFIGNQRFNYTNSFHNHQRYSSVEYGKKNDYQKDNYYRNKQVNNNNYVNNFLKIEKINKNDINSIKNNTTMTYYNKGYTNKKTINNNIFPETYYRNFLKYKAKSNKEKIISKSYNNIKVVQDNIHTNSIKNLNLFLPDFRKEKNNNDNYNQKNIKKEYNASNSVSNKENKNSIFNNHINNNDLYNLKNNTKYFLNYKQKVLPKPTKNLATIGFIPNRNNYHYFKNNKAHLKNRGLSTDNKFMKPYKPIHLLSNSTSNKKTCPLCHKELDSFKYEIHFSYHPSQIFNWLYLGSYRNACDKQGIKDLRINYVLNCAIECKESFPSDIKYCHLKLSDSPSFKIIPHLEKATSFINEAQINNGIILVHCQCGISRSTSCIIAYFIKYMGYTAMGALEFIKKKRAQVMPNFGFLQQLKKYEKSNMGVGKKSESKNNEN